MRQLAKTDHIDARILVRLWEVIEHGPGRDKFVKALPTAERHAWLPWRRAVVNPDAMVVGESNRLALAPPGTRRSIDIIFEAQGMWRIVPHNLNLRREIGEVSDAWRDTGMLDSKPTVAIRSITRVRLQQSSKIRYTAFYMRDKPSGSTSRIFLPWT
jgi:hypothetical protein